MREEGQEYERHNRDRGVKESVTRLMKSMTLSELTDETIRVCLGYMNLNRHSCDSRVLYRSQRPR